MIRSPIERRCPNCNVRVSWRAKTCFMCGVRLDDKPRRGWNVAWTDLALAIGVLAIAWGLWTRGLRPQQLGLPTPPLATVIAIASPTPIPTATPATTALPTTPTPPTSVDAAIAVTPTPIVHVVASGESLQYIARLYGVRVADIVAANDLTNPDRLRIGQELLIPAPTAEVPATPPATPANAVLNYVVQPGDTLSEIALRYQTTVEAIQKANRMGNSEMIRPGDLLIIPAPRSVLEPTPTPTPTPIPTSEYRWPAPSLLSPADRALIPAASEPTLRWTAVGILDQDEWYVVRLWPEDNNLPVPPAYWTKGTSWRVEAKWQPPETARQRRYNWVVTVIRSKGTGQDARDLRATSPTSAQRSFIWGEAVRSSERAPLE